MRVLFVLISTLVKATDIYHVNPVEVGGLDIKPFDGQNSPIATSHGSLPGDARYATFQTNVDIISSMIDYMVIL